MKAIRYINGASTVALNQDACVGCGACTEVCPHGVFALAEKKAVFADRDACIECGACARNCPTEAISVTPGVGCAAYIISGWIKGPENASCGCSGSSGGCCC
ncbi:MAG: ferredoxin family protein [Deltaproteobacteria bacterium]|nr:ferredoxin family protein [Deltaproteobacteria bacterium]